MINSKTLRIAGAAVLGTLVGTSPAYAQITVGTGGKAANPAIYAQETLTDLIHTAGNVDYYRVTGQTPLSVTVPLEVAKAATDVLTVTFAIENMVLIGGTGPTFPTTAAAALIVRDAADAPFTTGVTQAFVTSVVTGRQTMAFTIGGAAVLNAGGAAGHSLNVVINNLAVREDMDGTMEVSVRNNANGVARATTLREAVKVVSALDITNTDASRGQPVLTAGVEFDFERFTGSVGGRLFGRLGGYSLTSGPTGVLTAPGPAVGNASALFSSSRSRIGGRGDVSFVDDVYLDPDSDCDSPSSSQVSLVMEGDDDSSKAWKEGRDRPLLMNHLSSNLCIKVDGETEIPETENSYELVLDFDPVAGAPFAPTDATLEMGSIIHNAAEATIPYVTTSELYNQRLVLTNDWGEAAPYTISFTTEEGVTATLGDGASGNLAAEAVTVLRMADVVDIEGGSRAAASVVIEAPDGRIGVATTQVRLGAGTTDTVVYEVR